MPVLTVQTVLRVDAAFALFGENRDFCKDHPCVMRNVENDSFLMEIQPENRYRSLREELTDWGCTHSLLDLFDEAYHLGCQFLLVIDQ